MPEEHNNGRKKISSNEVNKIIDGLISGIFRQNDQSAIDSQENRIKQNDHGLTTGNSGKTELEVTKQESSLGDDVDEIHIQRYADEIRESQRAQIDMATASLNAVLREAGESTMFSVRQEEDGRFTIYEELGTTDYQKTISMLTDMRSKIDEENNRKREYADLQETLDGLSGLGIECRINETFGVFGLEHRSLQVASGHGIFKSRDALVDAVNDLYSRELAAHQRSREEEAIEVRGSVGEPSPELREIAKAPWLSTVAPERIEEPARHDDRKPGIRR